jgi:predicted SnoaL-like aldol condensation-catalyzing enzyme/ketosteroid isomerase-like protein
MKKSFPLAAALIAGALLTAAPASAQQRALSDPVIGHPNPESLFTSKNPRLNRNKQAALHIQRELLKCHEWDRASEWLTDKYIQHNPVAASGLKGVVYYFTQVAKQKPLDPCPALSASDPNAVVAVVAEGDYVTILTKRTLPYADDPKQSYTTTWFDTWRFVDGKADEHWDPMALGAGPGPSAGAAANAKPAPPPQAAAMPMNTGAMPMNTGAMAMGNMPGGMQAMQRQADRDAIEALQWKYDRALDRFNAEAYVALYTEDGSFGQVKGRDALRKMMTGFTSPRPAAAGQAAAAAPAGPPKLQHATSNDWIEFTGSDSATVHYYWQTYALGSGKLDDPPKLLAAGNGVDQVVKQNGQWLFKSRQVVAPDD